MKKTIFAVVAAVALLCAGPALADTNISFTNVAYPGTFQGVTPGGVLIGTQYGTMTVPTAVASIKIGGVSLSYAQMQTVQVGTPVMVALPPTQGVIYSANPNVIVVQQQPGVLVPVPYGYLPTATLNQRVYVRKHNGKIVNVPLNAAMNMQRANQAVILGHGNPGLTNGTTINVDVDVSSKGKGKGKGKYK